MSSAAVSAGIGHDFKDFDFSYGVFHANSFFGEGAVLPFLIFRKSAALRLFMGNLRRAVIFVYSLIPGVSLFDNAEKLIALLLLPMELKVVFSAAAGF